MLLMDEPLCDRHHLVEAVGQLRGLVGGVDVDQDQARLGRGELRGVPGDRVNTSPHQLHCTVLYCTVLYCTVLHYTVLHCTVVHCTVCRGDDGGGQLLCGHPAGGGAQPDPRH